MENRLAHGRTERAGTALIALAAIVAVTAAWWALALWPAGTVEPEWLTRTRAACFGVSHGGLPDAAGWILLIGEPLGMIGALFVVWGGSLKRDLASAWARPLSRFVTAAIAILALAATSLAGARVVRAAVVRGSGADSIRGVAQRVDLDAPAMPFVDQHGRPTLLSDFRGHRVVLTFAYGHCTTVCPAIVHDLLAVRRKSGASDLALVVITVDPWRDTPDRLPTIAEQWGLEKNDRVLSGDVANVEAALDQLGIGRRRNDTTGDIDHGSTAMMLEADGRITSRMDGGWINAAELLQSPH